ncbi:Importin-5 [Porphyridium purpureum]|uniref:Importin-5 n=1 Tax=Porphyridium purpureum TaxID=35688 RepID=A0A5J4Z999_PORPP|nr:Importin-5 [Porphyridium purpureum]|eukprot:POR6449..scf295_1
MAHTESDAAAAATAAMENILRQLQSPNNEMRNEAEAAFNAAKQRPGTCLDALCTLAITSNDMVMRAAAAVLLRRTAIELWEGATEDTKIVIKQKLLQGVRSEPNANNRKKLCDTVSVLASGVATQGGWPELFPFLFEMSKSPSSHDRESALYIFSQLPGYISTLLEPHLGTLHQLFHVGLNDPDQMVRVAALKATCSILNTFESSKCKSFEDLVPFMLRPVSESLNASDEDTARTSIEMLIDVMDTEPRFWRNHLEIVVAAMLSVASSTSLEESTRQLGLEFLTSAAEKLPTACRKLPNFASSVIPVAMGMMLEIEDESEWYAKDDDDDDAMDYTNFDAGQESLDRLAISLGGKTVLPIAFTLIPQFLNNADSWTHRHAGLLALSQIGEGCERQIEDQLGHVIALALQRFGDPHPRVRWAAINCVGQMCTDFGPRIQREFHGQILPALIAVMDDAGNPRVQSHAAAAVINFCDEATPEIIGPYMELLLAKLLTLLQSNRKITQEQAVTAVAAVADAAASLFSPFYDTFMPLLRKVLTLATGRTELRRLRGKVMECISLIGLSVGREKFVQDAEQVMDILVRTQGRGMDADDPQSFYLMQAYARICRCLKDLFIPYLPYVMPGLLEAAAQKPDIEVLDALDDEDEEEDDGMETIRIGDKRIGIRTSALDDKATAVGMIACFVAELGAGFFPYVEQTAQVMVPLLKFFYHDECRSSAASCCPDLIKCVAARGESSMADVKQLFNFIMPTMLDAISGEPDVEVLVVLVEALGESINAVGPAVIAEETAQLHRAVFIIAELLQDRAERKAERAQQALADEWDEEEQADAELEGAKDDEMLDLIGDAIEIMLRNAGPAFLSAFESAEHRRNIPPLVQTFAHMLAPERPSNERRVALCVFCDVIEHGGPGGVAYTERVLPAMQMYCTDEDPSVRQAAAYGIGACAKFGGEAFARAGGEGVLGPLGAVVSAPQARSEEYEMSTDNAISALIKMLEFQTASVLDINGVMQAVLSYLPMKCDLPEAKSAHGGFLRLVERGEPFLYGPDFVNLMNIFRIFAELLGTELMDDADIARSILVLKSMYTRVPEDKARLAISRLTSTHQARLQAALSHP